MAERRTLVAGAAIALALGLVGYAWWSREASAPSDPRVPAAAPAETAQTRAPAAGDAPTRPVASPRAALPSQGTPIAQIAVPLKARADAGDSRAACRLAMELLRCQHLEQAKSVQWAAGVPPEESFERQGRFEAANAFAEIEIRKIQLGQHCDALDPALVAQASHYLEAAARAGEPEAMLRYATGAHHGQLGQMGYLRDPGFERWRRDSPGMLLRAAQSGDIRAVNLLAQAYGSNGSPFAGLIPDDPLQANAWTLLGARLGGVNPPDFENTDAAIELEARALASRWHQRYFGGKPPGTDRSALMLQPLHFPFRPVELERFCE